MSSPETNAPSTPDSTVVVDGVNQLLQRETDAELLGKYVLCQDRSAMERLIVRYGPMVYSVCRATANCRNDAEDAFQATFLILIQSAGKVRKQSSLAAWLHGVAYRTASRTRLNSRRAQGVQLDDDSELQMERSGNPQLDPILLVSRKIELEWLFKELDRLPQQLKAALVEYYLHGYSTKEISDRMEISVSAVEGRLRRGRHLLRSRLIQHGLSLSVALGAVEFLRQQLQAAEAGCMTQQFVSQQLSVDAIVGSTNSVSSTVNSLIKGEISMLKNSLLSKSVLSLAAFGALGTVAAWAYVNDQSGGGKPVGSGQQTTVISSTQEPEKLNKAPVLLAQLGPIRQSAAASQPPTQNSGQAVTAPASDEPKATQDSQGGNGSTPTQPIQPTQPTQQARAGEAKTPPIVKWKTPDDNQPLWLVDTPDDQALNQRKEQVRSTFRSVASKKPFTFQAIPLNEVMEQISEEMKLGINIDVTELENEGIQPDTPVTANLPPCSYREALDVMLKPLALTYRIREFGIEITTESSVEDGEGELRSYDLSYIYRDSSNLSALIDAITTSIEPDSWLENGGSSNVSMVGSVMVVTCPHKTHFKIEELLRTLAKMSPENSTPQLIRSGSLVPTGAYGGMGGGRF